MEIKLSKLESRTIAVIYHEFLKRRECGTSWEDAQTFEEWYKFDESSFKHPDDFAHGRKQLRERGLITEDVIGTITLTDEAIAMMENRFNENIKLVADYLLNAASLAITLIP